MASNASSQGNTGDAGLSQHLVDRLIRELVRTGRAATVQEIQQIIERMITVPINPERIRVPMRHRGLTYQGHSLAARDDSLIYHLTRRVLDGQWADGTTAEQYVADLRRAIRLPDARLTV